MTIIPVWEEVATFEEEVATFEWDFYINNTSTNNNSTSKKLHVNINSSIGKLVNSTNWKRVESELRKSTRPTLV